MTNNLKPYPNRLAELMSLLANLICIYVNSLYNLMFGREVDKESRGNTILDFSATLRLKGLG